MSRCWKRHGRSYGRYGPRDSGLPWLELGLTAPGSLDPPSGLSSRVRGVDSQRCLKGGLNINLQLFYSQFHNPTFPGYLSGQIEHIIKRPSRSLDYKFLVTRETYYYSFVRKSGRRVGVH